MARRHNATSKCLLPPKASAAQGREGQSLRANGCQKYHCPKTRRQAGALTFKSSSMKVSFISGGFSKAYWRVPAVPRGISAAWKKTGMLSQKVHAPRHGRSAHQRQTTGSPVPNHWFTSAMCPSQLQWAPAFLPASAVPGSLICTEEGVDIRVAPTGVSPCLVLVGAQQIVYPR